jgi:CDP-glycerol glycerophosphotransferase
VKKLKDGLRQIMLLYKRFLYFLARLLEKTDDKTVVFEAFQGRSVACSPKALYMEMLENPKYYNYQLVWSLRNTNRPDMLENRRTHIVRFESFAYYRALARAKYWIFNSNTRPFLKPAKNQVFIQTWHGTPLKKIGCDVMRTGNAMTKLSDIEKIYTNEAKKISYMISPSEYCTEKFISAFNLKSVHKENRVLTMGYPRNDFLFKATEQQCRDIKAGLKLPEDKKVLLYAPTFRDNKYSAKDGFQLESYMDFEKAQEALGDAYVILFRAHYFISGRMNLEKYKGFVYDVSDVEDINELYVISDMLITDYSSVFFDYANLKRPILFYMCDYEEYKNELRDFYFDISELPAPVVKEQNQVFAEIKKLSDNFSIDENYRKFNKKYNYLDSGECSRKVLEKIIEV